MTSPAGILSRLRTVLLNLSHRAQLVIIGFVVGLTSGFAALGLKLSLESFFAWTGRLRWPWLSALFPALGILLTVLLFKYVLLESGGHGVPEVISSVNLRGGRLRFRSAYSQLLGALITLGSGGSAGPEAPVVISGASLGSNIAGGFKANDRIRVAVVGSGAAAAISSIFNAPITGIIFTMEVILGEWTSLNLLPAAIASATGAVVSQTLSGNQIPFPPHDFQISLSDVLAAVPLALLASLCAAAMIRALRLVRKSLRFTLKHDLTIALGGGALVGLLTLFAREVRGEGYEVVRRLITGEFRYGLVLILLLILAKTAATALTIGSGGAGGVFAPSLVIGSLCGMGFYQLSALLFPGVQLADPGLYALVGMAGVLSGILHAPLTGIFLVFEITGSYDAILPLLIVSFLASTLVRLMEKRSVYQQELVRLGQRLRPRTDARILSDLQVDELLETGVEHVHPEMTLEQMVPVIHRSKRDYYTVLEKDTKRFLGMVMFNDIKPYLFTPELLRSVLVEEVMRTDLLSVAPGESLVEILRKFDISGAWSLPVVQEGRFLGLVSKSTILDHYRKELLAQTEF